MYIRASAGNEDNNSSLLTLQTGYNNKLQGSGQLPENSVRFPWFPRRNHERFWDNDEQTSFYRLFLIVC
jgi:hypothetical protein